MAESSTLSSTPHFIVIGFRYPRPFLCLMNVSSHALDRLVQEEEEKILLRPPGFLHGSDMGAAFFVTKNSLMAVWQRRNFEDYDPELRRNPRPLPNVTSRLSFAASNRLLMLSNCWLVIMKFPELSLSQLTARLAIRATCLPGWSIHYGLFNVAGLAVSAAEIVDEHGHTDER